MFMRVQNNDSSITYLGDKVAGICVHKEVWNLSHKLDHKNVELARGPKGDPPPFHSNNNI